MHFFDFRDDEKNERLYGVAEPPVYDISKIIAKNLSFWYGNKDTIVTPKDVEVTISRLKGELPRIVTPLRFLENSLCNSIPLVPSQRTFINQTGIMFNHASFFTHLNVSRLLIIPCMRALELRS